jgi:transcriptional regulator with XRE-family HTH domain
MNNLEDLIKSKYGTVDKMLEKTDQISRAYIYQIINGSKNNPTKDILKELSRLLDVSIDKITELLDAKEV